MRAPTAHLSPGNLIAADAVTKSPSAGSLGLPLPPVSERRNGIKDFYSDTSMGAGFDHNPVLQVQRRQLAALPIGADGMATSVLDLGCGAGTTTRVVLAGFGPNFSVVGADLSPTALRKYKEVTGRPAVRLSATELPFPADTFDLIISDDLIEHLVDTDEYAREIMRVLRPDGWLMLSTPNLAAWFNRIGLMMGMQPAFTEVSFERVFGRPGSDLVGHLRVFTSKSTRQFLEHHGFEVVGVEGARFEAIRGIGGRVDKLFARIPSLAGNTAIVARRATSG